MTRTEAIEAMARAMADLDGGVPWDEKPAGIQRKLIQQATAAYDALLPHIQGERERVREMCANEAELHEDSLFMPDLIRALDIGGQDE